MKKILLVSLLILSAHQVFSQKVYNHGVFWGRLVLSDTINNKFKWELSFQKRTQTASAKSNNIFDAPHVITIWPWINYKLSGNTRLLLSPVAYFESHPFYNTPEEVRKEGVKEFRTSLRVENEQKLRLFNYSNRYSLEYRLRDLKNNNNFQPNWRARYMFKLERPFKNVLSSKKPLSAYVSDEVLIQFGDAVKNNPNIFDQNRINVGVAYEVYKNVKLNVSYLNILQERISGKEIDNANCLWVILTFDNLFSQFKKSKS